MSRRSIAVTLSSVLAIVVVVAPTLWAPAGAVTCPPQRDGVWSGAWASNNPLNGSGTWGGDLTFYESGVSGGVTLTGSVFSGGPATGSISCSTITFGTVGGEITFVGTLAPDGQSASGSYSVIYGDTGTWSGTLTTPDPPTVSVGSASIQEGNGGMRLIEVPVTLSRPATTTVSVAYGTIEASAAELDYVDKSGTLTFAPGSDGLTPTTKWIKIKVKGDTEFEGDESFAVVLSNPNGATINNGLSYMVIQDDEAVAGPAVTLSWTTVFEGDQGKRDLRLTLWLSQPANVPVAVEFSTGDATAVAPGDYRPKSDELTFKPGQVRKAVTIPVVADNLNEGQQEQFYGYVLSATGAPVHPFHDVGIFTIYEE